MQIVPPRPNLRETLDTFIATQTQQNKEFMNQNAHTNELVTQISTKFDQMMTHHKMLETQISQVAQTQATQTTPGGQFPGQTQPNPKGQANVITLRSGTAYDGPKLPTMCVPEKPKKDSIPEDQVEKPEEPRIQQNQVEESKDKTYTPPPPYKPPIPYP